MISFQSRNSAIRQADRITRKVNSVYPHISESKTRININHFQCKNYPNPICYKFGNLNMRNSNKLDKLRYGSGAEINSFRSVIDMLKNHKMGNCYEESILAHIIGKINGLENIYPANIFFNNNSRGGQLMLDHVVTIITDKPFKDGYKFNFKNKDAIVIDSWLGITEYAADYIRRLKTNFIEFFPGVPDFKYSLSSLASRVNNISQFKKERKKIFKPDFLFKLHTDELLSMQDAKILRNEFPELILK